MNARDACAGHHRTQAAGRVHLSVRALCVCVCVCVFMQAVVAFVRALCTVSREELENVKAPRMFSLTCLVQVAHFNMKRIRWGQTPHTR